MTTRRYGISEIVSTTIILSALLLIAVSTLIIANNMFNYKSDNVEFEEAKNSMINLASIIEGISGRVGAAGYVKFNTVSGGPEYISNIGYINVSVLNGSLSNILGILSDNYDIIRYRGGNLVGVGGVELLRGTFDRVINNSVYPLGTVYVFSGGGSYVILNFSRVNIIYLGRYNFTEGIVNNSRVFRVLNIIELHYIKLRPGSFSGGGSINLIARTTNVTINYSFIPNHALGMNNVTFLIDADGRIMYNEIPIDASYDTMIICVISEVEIDMVGS